MENKDSFQKLTDTTKEVIEQSKNFLDNTSELLSQTRKTNNHLSSFLKKQKQIENNRGAERKRIINQYLEANKLYDNNDYKKAAEIYRALIEPQIADEQREWGTLFFKGDGVQQSYIEAAYWWNLAVQNGDSYAPAFLSSLFIDGLGVEPDLSIAMDLLKLGVERGDAQSKRVLGIVLLTGNLNTKQVSEKNINKGFELLLEAAEESDNQAMGIVGTIYLDGEYNGEHLVDKDVSKGYKLLTEAAESGDPQSQYYLARYYSDDEYMDKDESKARFWAEKAYNNGYEQAKVILNALNYRHTLGEK